MCIISTSLHDEILNRNFIGLYRLVRVSIKELIIWEYHLDIQLALEREWNTI